MDTRDKTQSPKNHEHLATQRRNIYIPTTTTIVNDAIPKRLSTVLLVIDECLNPNRPQRCRLSSIEVLTETLTAPQHMLRRVYACAGCLNPQLFPMVLLVHDGDLIPRYYPRCYLSSTAVLTPTILSAGFPNLHLLAWPLAISASRTLPRHLRSPLTNSSLLLLCPLGVTAPVLVILG